MGADQTFQQDCIELLKEQTEGRAVNRRHFLAVLAALGVSPLVCRLSPAHAQAKEIVVVNWGGDAVAAMTRPGRSPSMRGAGRRPWSTAQAPRPLRSRPWWRAA